MFKKLFHITLFFILCSVLTACSSPMSEATKNILYKPSGEFRPTKEVIKIMQTLPLPERYDVYREGVGRLHPPVLALAKGIIPLGNKSIPFLKGKLQTVGKWEKIDIIELLVQMSDFGYYDVKSDPILFKTIIDAKNQIIRDDSSLKNYYSLDLNRFNYYKRFEGNDKRLEEHVNTLQD